MTEQSQGPRRGRIRLWLALSAVAVIVALLVVPPFISVRRYKSRITELVSASVGRPVRLSSVELRILPRPSFVMTDLVVEEDPAYGSEPVLHANTVTASIRMLPLWWRARLEISRISVDEASLNIVRTGTGKWNLDSFFRSAAARAQGGSGDSKAMPFPYLEATDSRVNIKNGVEKLPYSLVNSDLSLWQESPGEWRVRLKGQPARTDVSLDLADTGIVRLEGRLRRAPELRHFPIHLDVDWRDAQLGQLSRLLLGDDEGWRGDLTGQLQMDGTVDTAQVTTRLRTTGVHRAEFAPASPMDFDAACSFIYHYSDRAVEKLLCDSPVGNGRVRLTGDLPSGKSDSQLTLELDRIPAQLGLDTLRTLRNGIDPSLQAEGAISGRLSYAPFDAADPIAALPDRDAKSLAKAGKTRAPAKGPLSGSITVANLRITGDALSRPLLLPKLMIEPDSSQPTALETTVALTLGAPAPLNVMARFASNSYWVGIRGAIGLLRLRELARMAGLSYASDLEQLEGPPVTLELEANGPWLRSPAPRALDSGSGSLSELAPAPVLVGGASDHLTGSVTLHGASWKPDFMANGVELSNAVLHFDESGSDWDPIAFSYGPVRGTATLHLPANCGSAPRCSPRFTLGFSEVDSAALQAALLGTRKPGTLLSNVFARLKPGSTPEWPAAEGTVHADSLLLGPVTVSDADVTLNIRGGETDIRSLDAGLLGGRVHIEGSLVASDKPDYKLKGQFDEVNAADVGRLLGMNWSGNPISGSGEIELGGFTENDLAASAKGSLHFDWRHGSVAETEDSRAPALLVRFDRWTADAEIGDGTITLKNNQLQRGARKMAVAGSAVFGAPPHVTFGEAQNAQAASRQEKQ